MAKHILFVFVFLIFAGFANDGYCSYPANKIPDMISKGSDAVVREYNVIVDYKSPTSATMKVTRVITVMNSEGESHANFSTFTDKGRTIKSFSGEVYDANGKSVRKIKKGDLKLYGYSHGLADDSKTLYYELHMAKYPYTVRYDYEITIKRGMFTLPMFSPVPGYRTGIERSSYSVTMPAGTEYRIKQVNLGIDPEKTTDAQAIHLKWETGNITPIDKQPFSPSQFDVLPMIVVAPDRFHYEGYDGKISTWEEYGRWQCGLLEGRDELPAELKSRIKAITSDVSSDRDKVRILYDFLGEQTRYVSIQLGIGGWQPMKAADAYTNKFGDCKALTNLLMAMLHECGIESYYTEIGLNEKRIWEDFPNAFQTNHVILYVPLDDGELWLECTNPDLPFGYIHKDIAGNDALICRKGIMEFVTLPQYPDSLHCVASKLEITLEPDRSARMKFISSFSGHRYEDMWGYDKLNSQEQNNKALSIIGVPLGMVSNITYKDEKSPLPVYTIGFDVEAIGMGNIAGNRILLPVNPLYRELPRLGRSRQLDIHIESGFIWSDTVVYNLPQGYIIESLPEPFVIGSEFGSYKLEVAQSNGGPVFTSTFSLNSGIYDVEQYDLLREFFRSIDDRMKTKVVIKPADS